MCLAILLAFGVLGSCVVHLLFSRILLLSLKEQNPKLIAVALASLELTFMSSTTPFLIWVTHAPGLDEMVCRSVCTIGYFIW